MMVQIGLEPIHGENTTDEQWEEMLRETRDTFLAASDWTQIPDNQLTDDQRLEWASYRQALRDLPDTAILGMSVEFPDPPS